MSRPRIIANVNHKGGVGKTTTTLNLSKALSMIEQRVLMIDIDPQANLSQSVGIEDAEINIYHALCEKTSLPITALNDYLHIVPSSLLLATADAKLLSSPLDGVNRLNKALAEVKSNYDYILIDCPPSLGILTDNAMVAATEVLIILQCHMLALKGMETIIEHVDTVRESRNSLLNISGIVMTQFEKNTVVANMIVDEVRSAYGELAFQTIIRKNIAVVESSTVPTDIFSYDPKSNAAKDYLALREEFVQVKVNV